MPRGEEEEIVERSVPLLFFFAPVAARVFLAFLNVDHRPFENRIGCGPNDPIAIRKRIASVAHHFGNQV